ncbi:MAG: radical SAM protein [Deltaproteobacteria bacterium]|nr:radical SAM protein [Deltaproteobacteria bacterium]
MGLLEDRDATYLTTVRGMCRTCREIVPARVVLRAGKVWQQSLCPTCRNTEALIAEDSEWYLQNAMRAQPDRAPRKGAHPSKHGCPHDCGPCTWHASSCQLPVLSITNACNLNCPICFTYNRPDRIYHMPVEEMRATVDWIVESSAPVDLINITGGEPTLHPQLLDILRCCKRPEIGRITMNSNGLRLAKDPALCEQLAELGVYVILSFNTFEPKTSIRLHGRDIVEDKLRAIENLSRAGVRMTLLQVMERGVEEDVSGRILELMASNDNILSHTVQTMTYTGQGGGQWAKREHIPVDEAARMVAKQSKGALQFSDFLPRPASHPLCYLTCYMVKVDQTFLPFARFAPAERISALMQDSYLIRLDLDQEFFKDVVQDLFAKGETGHLKTFRSILEKLYPGKGPLPTAFERQRLAESAVRTIYVHAHMDEDNFDCSRAMMCPDLVPCEPGRLVPACTYNLFYRMKDERFYVLGPDARKADSHES